MRLSASQWAAIRKTAYALIPAVGTLLVGMGWVSEDKWQVAAGLIAQVLTFAVAFFNTSPSQTAELAELRAADEKAKEAPTQAIPAAPAVNEIAEAVVGALRDAGNASQGDFALAPPRQLDPVVGGQGESIAPVAAEVNPQGEPTGAQYEPKHAAEEEK